MSEDTEEEAGSAAAFGMREKLLANHSLCHLLNYLPAAAAGRVFDASLNLFGNYITAAAANAMFRSGI